MSEQFVNAVTYPLDVPAEYAAHARERCLEEAWHIVAKNVRPDNIYTVRYRTEAQQVDFNRMEYRVHLDLGMAQVMDMRVPRIEEMPTNYVVRTAVQELKYRVRRWWRSVFKRVTP